jgi:hypothetical protein
MTVAVIGLLDGITAIHGINGIFEKELDIRGN